MEIVSKSVDGVAPTKGKLGEFSNEELKQNSGVFKNSTSYAQISNLKAIEVIFDAWGAQGVYLNTDEYLSRDARDHNRDIHRDNGPRNKIIYAVIVRLAPDFCLPE